MLSLPVKVVVLTSLVILCLTGAAPRARGATGPGAAAPERHLIIIYTAEVRGAVEPCGCTSDPLGDISRFAEVVRAAKKETGAVLLVDAGGLLYGEGGISARERPAADARAAFLATELERLGLAGAGLAETDLAAGPALVRPRRLASNFFPAATAGPATATTATAATIFRAPEVHLIGAGARGVKVGVLGIADPALGERLGIKSDDVDVDIVKAAQRDADRLRRDGAEVVVLLAPVDKSLARRVARAAAVDLVVLGRQVGSGMARAETVTRGGDAVPAGGESAAFLLAPADELQRIGRIDVVLRAGAPRGLRDAGGPGAIQLRQDEIDRAVKRLDADLGRWNATGQAPGPGAGPRPDSDASFVAAKRRERASLIAERAALSAPWTPPAVGSYFTNHLIPLRRSLPRDPTLVAAMKRLDATVAAINAKNAQPPPPAEPGRASFVGVGSCGRCHARAVQFWKQTVHATAWKTLVDGGKQADYRCIGCHLTGYGQVGGSSLGFTKGLQAVQCENCHGPASIHVAQHGLEEPSSLHREVPETTCLGCHNEQHSDTFQYQAYLRDILGVGHGADARRKLGDGPTGHALRAAAMARAGQTRAATATSATTPPP